MSSDRVGNASSVIVTRRQGPPFLVRVLWYLFIGWWLAGISLALGYLAAITIVGLPLAFWIFDRTGTLLTLRPRPVTVSVSHGGSVTVFESGHREQRSLLLRVVYFILVGWCGVEFPRFGGHLLTEFVSVGKDVRYAKDPAVFTGVPLGGCEAVAEQRSFCPAARS